MTKARLFIGLFIFLFSAWAAWYHGAVLLLAFLFAVVSTVLWYLVSRIVWLPGLIGIERGSNDY